MSFQFLRAAGLVMCSVVAQPGFAADAELATTVVEIREIEDVLWFDGIVEAVNQSTVSSQTSGRIVGLDFDVNDFVNEGEIIVRFSDAEHKTRLSQAEANLQSAVATRTGADDEYRRIERLLSSGTVAKARFDAAKTAYDTAKAHVRTALAAVEQSKEQLGYTVVRAPYSGLVVARHVQIGEVANRGEPLMTGFSLDELRVSVAVPQQYAAVIRQANSANIIDDESNLIESTELTVFPFADKSSNTVTVRAKLPTGTSSVFPGMLVKTAFTVGTTKALTVAQSALVQRGEVVGVYLVDEQGKVKLQQVRSGHIDTGGNVEILAGLEAGDRIASDPVAATQVLQAQADNKR